MRKRADAKYGAYRSAFVALAQLHRRSSAELIEYNNGCFGILLSLDGRFTLLLGNDSVNFTELSIVPAKPSAVRKLIARAHNEAVARNYVASLPLAHAAALPPFQGSPLTLAGEKYVEWVECQVEKYGEDPLQATLTAAIFRDFIQLLATAEQTAFSDRILFELNLEKS